MNFNGYLFKNSKEFIQQFKARFNYEPDYHNASGIADVAVFKDAIERAGSLDPQKVRDAIAATKLDTIYGPVEFSENGQIKGTSVVLQIQGGEIYQVFPNGTKSERFVKRSAAGSDGRSSIPRRLNRSLIRQTKSLC